MSTTNTKTKRELADEILRELFDNRERVPIAEIVAAGCECDVSYRTLQRAKVSLGISEIHNGPYGAFWAR